MKTEKTISKTIRIPKSVYNEIMQEAERTNSDFCKVANYRLKHFGSGLTPEITSRIWNIINESYEMVWEHEPTRLENIREDAIYICRLLK